MTQHSRYAAFLSYAEPDRHIAEALSQLLLACGLQCYFAPTEHQSTASADWRKQLVDGISSSAAFIPILTRHSIRRPWVLYEAGIAAATAPRTLPVRVASVDPNNPFLAPIVGPQHILALDNREDLISLATVLFVQDIRRKRGHGNERPPELLRAYVLNCFEKSQHLLNAVLSLAARRSVFIAGNIPFGDTSQNLYRVTSGGGLVNIERAMARVLEDITRALLRADWTVGSCPVVEAVGQKVTLAASDWFRQHGNDGRGTFEIGGLYPLAPLSASIPGIDNAEPWKKRVREYRKTYLRNYEWLMIVGGNEGTRDEYEAAVELGSLKVTALPFFQGFGKSIWPDLDLHHRGSFATSLVEWTDAETKRVVDHLTNPSGHTAPEPLRAGAAVTQH